MPKKQKHRKQENNKQEEKVSPDASAAAYDIQMSQAAEDAYRGYFERAEAAKARGDTSSAHITALNMIDEVIEKIIPRDPFNRKYALTGNLSRVFRMQKGRLRICWLGSSVRRKIYVIFISETLRKAGDVNDPYRLLTNMVLSGEFDALFHELGLKRPSSVERHPIRQQ
jgi:hypothetical protein